MMHCTAASPLDSMETGRAPGPGIGCAPISPNNPARFANGPKGLPAPGRRKIICYLLSAQDTTAKAFAGGHPVESRHPWLGPLKGLFWTAAAIGLSLGIACL